MRKTDPRLVAYADCHEANSAIGVALALGSLPSELASVLQHVQNDLFDVGAGLCVLPGARPQTPAAAGHRGLCAAPRGLVRRVQRPPAAAASWGHPGAALLNTARAVTRRAERSVWALLEHDPERTSTLPAKYLNRLSDLLYTLGRLANPDGDVLWQPGGTRSQ